MNKYYQGAKIQNNVSLKNKWERRSPKKIFKFIDHILIILALFLAIFAVPILTRMFN